MTNQKFLILFCVLFLGSFGTSSTMGYLIRYRKNDLGPVDSKGRNCQIRNMDLRGQMKGLCLHGNYNDTCGNVICSGGRNAYCDLTESIDRRCAEGLSCCAQLMHSPETNVCANADECALRQVVGYFSNAQG